MTILQSLILGIIEGLTEFLPISSTFHLIWTAKIMQVQTNEFLKTFEVIIQSGAILAVVILYFNELIKNTKLIKNLIISFIPTALVGLFLYKTIKNVFFENYLLQILIFLAAGIFFLLYEKQERKNKLKQISGVTYSDAILIGLFQSLAIFPGVSRAGAVIIGMMVLKYSRLESAKYSFLLAIPTIISAGVLDLIKSDVLSLSASQISSLGVGFVTAFITAYVVIKWFITYLQKNTLVSFGWYRIIVAILLLSFVWI